MKNWSLSACVSLIMVALGVVPGCEGGGSSGDTGSSAIRGNVVSFQNTAAATSTAIRAPEDVSPVALSAGSDPTMDTSRMGGPGGITVSLTGPKDISVVTADDGAFSLTDLPAGRYGLSFAFNGEEVMYRGNSGQMATIAVQTNQTAELLNIRISGGRINIGNVRMLTDTNTMSKQ